MKEMARPTRQANATRRPHAVAAAAALRCRHTCCALAKARSFKVSLSLSQYEFAASDARNVRREPFAAAAAAAYQAAAWVVLALPPTPIFALALPSIKCSLCLALCRTRTLSLINLH